MHLPTTEISSRIKSVVDFIFPQIKISLNPFGNKVQEIQPRFYQHKKAISISGAMLGKAEVEH